MRKSTMLALMLAILFIFAFSISACQSSSLNPPEEDSESPRQENQGNDVVSDNQNQEVEEIPGDSLQEGQEPEDTQGIQDTQETQDTREVQETANENNGKLNIDTQVTLRENFDYVKIEVPSVDFELKDLNGNVVKLSDYKGQIVFLNFWATWCPPCREEMPDMESIHQQYGDKGVVMLGISSTELELRGGTDSEMAQSRVREFIEEEGYTFPILIDPDNKVVIEYHRIYPVTGIPTTDSVNLL